MNRKSGRVIIWGLTILLLLTIFGASAVLAQGGTTVFITTPAEGNTVSGVVNVTGAVDFPDFVKYDLFLKSGDQMLWGATAFAPVINGTLARLDTRTVPDGAYQLVVRQVHSDRNYTDFVGPTFYIENNLGAPLAYAEVPASPLYAPVSGAVARIKNCSGVDLQLNYHSPQGFCSSDDLWIKPKMADTDFCPFVDVLLTPCEYRGTAVGLGESRGATYSFTAEAGKVYEMNYAGGDVIYIAEIEAEERDPTDTGALPVGDPNRLQSPADAAEAVEAEEEMSTESTEAAASAEPAVVVATAAPAEPAEEAAPQSSDTVLPESGSSEPISLPFIIVGGGLIALLVIGGIAAARKRTFSA